MFIAGNFIAEVPPGFWSEEKYDELEAMIAKFFGCQDHQAPNAECPMHHFATTGVKTAEAAGDWVFGADA